MRTNENENTDGHDRHAQRYMFWVYVFLMMSVHSCLQFVAVNFSTIDWKLPCILYFARIDLVRNHDVTG